MKKQIVMDEDEYKNLLTKFVDKFQEYSKKDYGVHLVCNETGKRIDEFNGIGGSFLLPWNEVFKQ